MACTHQEVVFDVNTVGWAPFGPRTALSMRNEDPARLPATAVGHGQKPSGGYVLAAGRDQEEDGLCQAISPGALKPRVTYRVAGWISVAAEEGSQGHRVRVSIRVDDGRRVVDGGAVCAEAGRWTEIKGAFRLSESPSNAAVYVQGAPAGVDVKVMDLRIFATDRKARFSQLKDKTDKVRKRDVVLSFGGASGAFVRVVQLDNGFPLGTCINSTVIQDPAFVDFFTNHFDWAVFENELKWYWTEARRGQLNYADADRLLDFCDLAGKPVRGHCIFWAVDGDVQQWIKDIGHDRDQLMSVVQEHLQSLLGRYTGRFPHYDVNNEMLHGRFYRDRLGDNVAALMFREAARIDPGVLLFVNDYNVECGNDPNATPEKYIELIRELQQGGAQVGGIGLQGHVTNPVGEVICDALDKLSTTDLPIWITELDVCEPDEALRADDLEVVLREAYAHPAVQGVMLWGFMQGQMWRQDAFLVNSDGTVNDAGQRFIELRREWTSDARGHIDGDGQFKFRGFEGTYVVQVTTATGKMLKTFTVDKGDAPLVLGMDV
ncbi:endo-1,4-beta-xylanase 1-like [Phragmites australis]|uniref:endo-1,4-beta-xylanase 1-like n=1 Tax=Phragmites australis TaxID=29695 RepID=UPI002D7A352A|nr:endo-1,4-beta-xylanase 1-like [Phragmites australis]